MLINFLKNFRVNRVVRYFIVADLILFSGWGLVSPIFSIFVVEKIAGATLVNVGIGAATYWIAKSLMQLPLGRFLDFKKDEKLTIYVLLAGLVLTSISAAAFIFMTKVYHLYAIQFIHGLGMALYVIAWYEIFSHHLDKNKAGFEWAMNSSSLGFVTGVMALAGGYVASSFGFQYVFMGASVSSALAALVVFFVPDLIIRPKRQDGEMPQDHTQKTITH